MKKNKKIKKNIKEDNSNMDVDSLWGRRSAAKKDYAGKTVQQILDIEPDPPGNLDKTHPMSMMQIVMNSWGKGGAIRGDNETYEKEEDQGEGSHTAFDLEDDSENYDSDNDEENEEEDNDDDVGSSSSRRWVRDPDDCLSDDEEEDLDEGLDQGNTYTFEPDDEEDE